MATPCTSPSASSRRRSRWPDYQHENDQAFADSDSALSPWPTIAPVAAPITSMAESDPRTPLVSQADLAERLGVSVATLARARKSGLLVGHLIGGQWRFTEEQIADYLRRTEQPLRLYGKRRNDNDQS